MTESKEDACYSDDVEVEPHAVDTHAVFREAGKHALSGGVPGLFAMAVQVISLMWLHTVLNYQYRYGGTMLQAFTKLWREGGIFRLYRGLVPALMLAPTTRFVDTAANAGCISLLESISSTATLPLAIKTAAGSLCAGTFRMLLMPVDAVKTMMQVEGAAGLPILLAKVKQRGSGVLFHGALASGSASAISHFPWFATYNYLDRALPHYDATVHNLLRNAFIGFCASTSSAIVSNWVRVIKTAKQTSPTAVTYPQVFASIVSTDGLVGLAGRGLGTKIVTSGVQGILFTVLWKLGQQSWYEYSLDATPPTQPPPPQDNQDRSDQDPTQSGELQGSEPRGAASEAGTRPAASSSTDSGSASSSSNASASNNANEGKTPLVLSYQWRAPWQQDPSSIQRLNTRWLGSSGRAFPARSFAAPSSCDASWAEHASMSPYSWLAGLGGTAEPLQRRQPTLGSPWNLQFAHGDAHYAARLHVLPAIREVAAWPVLPRLGVGRAACDKAALHSCHGAPPWGNLASRLFVVNVKLESVARLVAQRQAHAFCPARAQS